MSGNNDKPSERSADKSAELAAITRAVSDRGTARETGRIIIRTAENRFDVPLDEIPSGMDYGWKVKTVNGQEAREAMINWRLNGWTPVPAGRHPGFSGEPADSQAVIERGGQILCERPMELSQQSRGMDRDKAKDQVRSQMDRLAGRARNTGSERVTKISKSWEPIVDDA